MIGWQWTALVSVLLAFAVGWLVPSLAMHALVAALEARGQALANYRGRRVVLGLGLVWPIWAAAVAATGVLVGAMPLAAQSVVGAGSPFPMGEPVAASAWSLAVSAIPVTLVLGAFAFGSADDAFGDAGARGFRGHLAALREGRLTTGALKLFGIGALALGGSWAARGAVHRAVGPGTPLELWGGLLLGALTIALAANLVNLTDLRPGRALKSYVLLVVAGAGAAASGGLGSLPAPFTAPFTLPTGEFLEVPSAVVTAVAAGVLLILALGPVAAVWRYDLGERAMLGDAGANAMGAFAGYLLASCGNVVVLAAITAVLLALNLASERVSFSAVIERVGILSWADGIGRLPADTGAAAGSGNDNGMSAEAGPAPVDHADGDTGKDGGS